MAAAKAVRSKIVLIWDIMKSGQMKTVLKSYQYSEKPENDKNIWEHIQRFQAIPMV